MPDPGRRYCFGYVDAEEEKSWRGVLRFGKQSATVQSQAKINPSVGAGSSFLRRAEKGGSIRAYSAGVRGGRVVRL